MKTIAFDAETSGHSPDFGSIRQNPRQNAIRMSPDWRNLGILLRTLLGVNLMSGVAALVLAQRFGEWFGIFVENAAWVEILLLSNLLVLAAARDLLWRVPYRTGQVLTLLSSAGCVVTFWAIWRSLGLTEDSVEHGARLMLLAVCASGAMLAYFDLRARAFAPHVEAARLRALNARIRPHFLFNSLNTVLALIRDDPRRAETALEELSDLFRALMRNPGDLVSLADEIALGRQYLDLEKLRLGERLQVHWDIRDVPLDLLMPPLILQPLLENAVHYGVAPSASGGEIRVDIRMKGEMLSIMIENPIKLARDHEKTHGNQMALSNIRARLALYYDMEAHLEHGPRDSLYHVMIELPCRFKTPTP
ncbi:MAG: histidine kinase [Zoogloeaceae bacterium]|nr:histidine kinase [Zoogloeaceae bacterium]